MVKIKFCGFTREEDIREACRLAVDYVGVICEIPGSPRSNSVERSAELLKVVSGANKVCVIRVDRLEDALRIVEKVKPDFIQLHPSLSPEEMSKLKNYVDILLVLSIPPCPDIRELLEKALRYHETVDFFVLDTHGPTGGGTGTVHDWSVSSYLCRNLPKPVFLAGGLNPENVVDAIKTVRPDGVDVSTGIEESPGKKDWEKMKRFVERVRTCR